MPQAVPRWATFRAVPAVHLENTGKSSHTAKARLKQNVTSVDKKKKISQKRKIKESFPFSAEAGAKVTRTAWVTAGGRSQTTRSDRFTRQGQRDSTSAVINLTKALRIMPEFTICPAVDRSKRNEDKFPIPHTQEVSGAGRRWHLLAQLFHQLWRLRTWRNTETYSFCRNLSSIPTNVFVFPWNSAL